MVRRSTRRNGCFTTSDTSSSFIPTRRDQSTSNLPLSNPENVDLPLQPASVLPLSNTGDNGLQLGASHPTERRRGRRPIPRDPIGTQYPCPFQGRGCEEIYTTPQSRKNHLKGKKCNPDAIHLVNDELWVDPHVTQMYMVCSSPNLHSIYLRYL
jgi:hypothetical protein